VILCSDWYVSSTFPEKRPHISMQTIQRTYEWRSGFGSTALAVLVSFFDTSKDFETNDQRRTFAENMTKDLRFIYAEALGNDPKVIGPSITIPILTV
jgi:hypothetical protein